MARFHLLAARSRRPVRALGMGVALLLAWPASAQETAPTEAPDDDIEEIVVLGAESDASDDFATGDSVTGFSAEDLEALGAQSVADLASFTPNLEIVTTGATTPTFFIRGVGLNDFNANATGAVALYADDVPINAPALQLGSLFDMEAVNVLRGPQGTGLARNASAGAIKLYSRKPTGRFGGHLRAEGGNFDHQDYEGAVEAPVYEDLLAARVAFRLSKRDGTMKNRCGSAPPREERDQVPRQGGPGGLFQLRKTTRSEPWSICGEPVTRESGGAPPPASTSPIPAGLPDYLNDRNNWAARGTMLFQPTLDQTWFLGLHGARRDEFSRVGQSYGTSQSFCLDNDMENCLGNARIEQRRWPNGSLIENVFGGSQGLTGGYQTPEVERRLTILAPCYEFGFNACSRDPANPDSLLLNRARIKVAKEISKDLDPRPYEGDFNEAGKTQNDTWGTYLNGAIALPGALELNSVTGFDNYDRRINIDLDFSPETLFHIDTEDNGWQVTQDLKLDGAVNVGETPVRWEVGGWALYEELDVAIDIDLGDLASFSVGNRLYTQDMLSTGVFGNLSFDFWEDFTLDGGVRFNYEQKEMDYLLFEPLVGDVALFVEDDWSAPTGTLRLTYRFRQDTHAYWKYTRGWKPGHFNATGSRTQGITVADPETLDAFETGLRGSWFDSRFILDASLFYYSYNDYQIFTAQQFAGGGPEFVVLNASDAEVYGSEVDAILRPWPGAFWNVRFAWLESQFLDFIQIQQAIINTSVGQVVISRELQNSGNPLLNSPQFKVSLTAEQTIPLGRYGTIAPRYDGVWTDITYYDATKGKGIPNNQNFQFLPDDTIAQKAFWLHNVRLGYRPPAGNMEIAFWIRNVADTAYKAFAFDGSTFQNTTIFLVGDPRTWGVSVSANF